MKLDEWAKMRDELLARREELRAELATIDAALAPLEAPTPPLVRRARRKREGSVSSRAEESAARVADGIGVHVNQISNALTALARRGVLVRRRVAPYNLWHYSVAPNIELPRPPLSETAAAPPSNNIAPRRRS